MRLFNRPGPLDPANDTHEAIARGCVVASTYYISKFAEGDTDVSPYWQQRAQAIVICDLLENR